jgi:hypothetical protein
LYFIASMAGEDTNLLPRLLYASATTKATSLAVKAGFEVIFGRDSQENSLTVGSLFKESPNFCFSVYVPAHLARSAL